MISRAVFHKRIEKGLRERLKGLSYAYDRIRQDKGMENRECVDIACVWLDLFSKVKTS